MIEEYDLEGPGLFAVNDGTENRMITNVRRIAGNGRQPGTVLIAAASWLLAIVGGGALFVSFAGQLTYVMRVRGQLSPSITESLLPDVAMLVFSLLALGLARAGKPSKATRLLVVAAAFTSAGMNLGASVVTSPRSVAVYVLPPVVCAVCVDSVISVIRRHVLAVDEPSAWLALGAAVKALSRFTLILALYSLRTALAPRSTFSGLRRLVLEAAPVPGKAIEEAEEVPELPGEEDHRDLGWNRWEDRGVATEAETVAMLITDGKCPVRGDYPNRTHCCADLPCGDHQEVVPAPTKKAAFLALYREHAHYGKREHAARAAADLAPLAELQPGTARTYAYAECARLSLDEMETRQVNGS